MKIHGRLRSSSARSSARCICLSKTIVLLLYQQAGAAATVGGASTTSSEPVCVASCARCVCCGCTLREAAARHEQRVAANERLERANLEWKQVFLIHLQATTDKHLSLVPKG